MPSVPESTPPPRRQTIAIIAAVAATTLAVGATAASLLGWFSPRATATEPPPAPEVTPVPHEIVPASSPTTILVPVAPNSPPIMTAAVAESAQPPDVRTCDDGDGDERCGEHDRERHDRERRGHDHHDDENDDD